MGNHMVNTKQVQNQHIKKMDNFEHIINYIDNKIIDKQNKQWYQCKKCKDNNI